MTFAAHPFSVAVNHLLAREAWARERLIPFAGKTARLEVAPVTIVLLVQADGCVAPVNAHEAGRCDVSIVLSNDALFAFAGGGQAAVMKHVKIDGDAEFATQIGKLIEHLRWEPEEDLAWLIGDAPAYRIAGLIRSTGEQMRRTSRGVFGSVLEYWLDEDPQLVRRTALAEFTEELSRTRDALARVEKRIERLEQSAGPSGSSGVAR